MIRVLVTAITIAAGVGLAPAAASAAPDANCIAGRMNADGSCVYDNCTEAKKAGVCDIPEGDPAYCKPQDRDNDGIACECGG